MTHDSIYFLQSLYYYQKIKAYLVTFMDFDIKNS